MSGPTQNPKNELLEPLLLEEELEAPHHDKESRERTIASLRLLWEKRRFLLRVAGYGLLVSTLLALVIPKRYESTARLMPPDSQSTSGLAMAAMLAGRASGVGALAGDLLGLKSTSALFVGMLQSRTVEDSLIDKFNLRKVYGAPRIEDARAALEASTRIAEDRKSGIITVTVTDRDPQRARAMAQAYVDELNRLVVDVSTSAARRERIFLEQRLKSVKQELDQAAVEFSQFASKNTTIDIKEQGRAMVEAAATLQGQLIAAQTELEGVRQIYTDQNVRVRALRARIAELKQQLEKLGGGDLAPQQPGNPGESSLYPSIRKLPLLAVEYADRYRRTKIAEVIYELLTQQYELAKVQEAKEIPTVKLLDAPVLPEKKSFPPRLLVIGLGTLLGFAGVVTYVLVGARWQHVAPEDPAKKLAQDVWNQLKADVRWSSPNGSKWSSALSALRSRFRRGKSTREEDSKGSDQPDADGSGSHLRPGG